MDYSCYHRDKDYLGNESLFRNIFLKRYASMNRFIEVKGKVLDIGCSTGVFLDLFKAHWETWGVEPSESGERAKAKGHKIVRSFFEKANLPKNFFDLAILNHTLEHMDDPLLVLKKVKTLLKDSGVIFVDVPNAGGLGAKILGKHWPYLLPLEHKHQFTRESFTGVFKKAGFQVIHFESRSGIFEFANPFLELWQSLVGLKKRFFTNILTTPYSLLATLLNMGDSMSFVGRKV